MPRCGWGKFARGKPAYTNRAPSSDMAQLKSQNKFGLASFPELGYVGIAINTGKGEMSKNNPLGRDPRVREAFELSLDRDGIVQVAADGQGVGGNQSGP